MELIVKEIKQVANTVLLNEIVRQIKAV